MCALASSAELSVKVNDLFIYKVSKGARIRNRYNQVPHLTQDTNGKMTNSQLDTTNERQEVSPGNVHYCGCLFYIMIKVTNVLCSPSID